MMGVFLLYLITILGGINLLRIAMMLILTEVHEIREHLKKQKNHVEDSQSKIQPWLSVIIPAYNEELGIIKSVESVCANTYPRFEIIVVDDGSKDKTSSRVRQYIRKHPNKRITLIRQKNAGKAHALNNGITHARGSLIMCLDADSTMATEAIARTVKHFQGNKKLVAMASNVHVTATGSAYGLMQKFEYILSYRLKRALNVLGSEYIIGGVGSTFRKQTIKKIGFYDTDTMTEDIDLTLKVVQLGNKKYQLGYGYDVHTYTQGVLNLSDLIKQRYRWKFGRMQAFLKHHSLFFNSSSKYFQFLTQFQLPYAVIGELALLVEPLFIGFILYNAIHYGELFPVVWIMCFMIFYIGVIILNDRDIPRKQRVLMFLQSPLVWLLFYVLTFVELAALLKSIIKLPKIKQMMAQKNASSWNHVKRTA